MDHAELSPAGPSSWDVLDDDLVVADVWSQVAVMTPYDPDLVRGLDPLSDEEWLAYQEAINAA